MTPNPSHQPKKPVADKKQRLALLVTGSIAAKKTVPLIGELRRNGLDVTVMTTRAPREWKWLSISEAKAAAGHDVLTDADDLSKKADIFSSSQIILIAPASANFIAQLAHEADPLAHAILDAQRKGAQVMLAPAMNFKMWEHPATQRNCLALKNTGCVFLGPVKGAMACGDEGYGRMIDVNEMAAGVMAASVKVMHFALSYFDLAQAERKSFIPYHAPEGPPRIVVALDVKDVPWPSVEKAIADIKTLGIAADYVIDCAWSEGRAALERLTRQRVISDYYEIPEFRGMEHIRLPERSCCVFFPLIGPALAMKMMQGAVDTLPLGIYFASKAPVITTKECLRNLSPFVSSILRRDGMIEIGSIERLRDFCTP